MKKSLLLLMVFSVLGLELSAQARTLDVTTFVVLGESLAAGVGDFSLKKEYQQNSFPAQVARQIQTIFPQPLMQSPGIGNVPGFPALPVRVPMTLQTTLRESPPNLFVFNLSVPGFKVSDVVSRQPALPLIQEDVQQTLTNMILGFPGLLIAGAPAWTQLEYARQMQPTLSMVVLGFSDVLEAAIKGDSRLLTDVAAFRTDYSRILSALKGTFGEIVVLTIPDPFDTAYFATQDAATRFVGAPAVVLRGLYKLKSDDILTLHALVAIGNQLATRTVGSLPAGSVISGSAATEVRNRVRALNGEITSLAQQNGAVVYDLNAFFNRIKTTETIIGSRILTGDYLGGFYTLNGYTPGTTGHALIANELIGLSNRTYNQSFPLIDVTKLVQTDPATLATSALTRQYTLEELEEFIPNLHELLENQPPVPGRKEQDQPEGGRK